MAFFENWGTMENPIRQSDLSALFGSTFRCAKRYALSKLYPREQRTIAANMAMGEILHDNINVMLTLKKRISVEESVRRYEEKSGLVIHFGCDQDERTNTIADYENVLQNLYTSDIFEYVSNYFIESERSFVVRVGKYHVAGTVDCIIKMPSGLEIIDWKTGHTPISQFEMNNSPQSQIYVHAVKEGEFFLRPEDRESGEAYYNSYKSTMEKNSFNAESGMIYAYIREIVPAAKDSKRKAKHTSSLKMANNGVLEIKKGKQRGPVMYRASVSVNLDLLEYDLSLAVLMAKSELFPGTFGKHCEKCNYREKCNSLKSKVGESSKQYVIKMMDELGIKPD